MKLFLKAEQEVDRLVISLKRRRPKKNPESFWREMISLYTLWIHRSFEGKKKLWDIYFPMGESKLEKS